jgi:PiT family inorganic phosphate transporter
MIYLLLAAGLFMGWSLGTNDAANAFGTAVATRVVKYRTAILIIAAMVLLGAGLVSGVKYVNFGVLKNVAIAWVSSPTIAGLLTWLVAVCTKSYFG